MGLITTENSFELFDFANLLHAPVYKTPSMVRSEQLKIISPISNPFDLSPTLSTVDISLETPNNTEDVSTTTEAIAIDPPGASPTRSSSLMASQAEEVKALKVSLAETKSKLVSAEEDRSKAHADRNAVKKILHDMKWWKL